MMHHFSELIKADEDQVANRTLLIRRVPKNKRNKEDLVIFFNKIFPDVKVEGIQFVYDIRQLNYLEQHYKNAANAKLYCHDYFTDYNERCEVRPHFLGQFGGVCGCCLCCPKVDGIEFYTGRERELEKDIKNELNKTVLAPSGSTFVTFSTEKMALE
jgi:Cytosolic domain of 10TM putative phosphate transporter